MRREHILKTGKNIEFFKKLKNLKENKNFEKKFEIILNL